MSRQGTQTGGFPLLVGGQRPEQHFPGEPELQVRPLALQVGTGSFVVVGFVVVGFVVVGFVVIGFVVIGFVVVGFVVVGFVVGFVVVVGFVQGFVVVVDFVQGVVVVVDFVQGFVVVVIALGMYLFSAFLHFGDSESGYFAHTSSMLDPQYTAPPGPLAMQTAGFSGAASGAGSAVAVEDRISNSKLLKMKLPPDRIHISAREGGKVAEPPEC